MFEGGDYSAASPHGLSQNRQIEHQSNVLLKFTVHVDTQVSSSNTHTVKVSVNLAPMFFLSTSSDMDSSE